MCTPQSIIEKVGSLVFDEAVKAAIERGKYVIDYKTNLRELQVEIRKLEGRREIIRRKVREAEDDGKSVYTSVLDWLEGADMMTRDVHDQQLVGQTEADRMTPDVEEQLVGQTEVDGVIRDVQEQLVGQTEADRVTRDVQEQLVGQSSDTGNMSCFKWSCPNIKRRYQLSKEAKEKIAGVKKLIEESHFNENEISYPRPPPSELEFPSNENYVDLDSRTPVFQRIVDALKHPSVNVIGVHGLGGVGKTTLVEEVGKKMRLDGTFKQVALAVVSKDLNVQKIQSQLAESLDFKWDANSDDQKGRAKQLWDKFTNGERFLVILDDVWTKVDIKAIGIPLIKGLTTGCKVVLTSRNEDLLVNRMNVDKPFPIAELQELEAWTLFKKKVGDSIESQPELYSLAYEVCKKCKGLPIAINALGEALKGKPNYTWKNALDKLERYMITNIDGIDSSVWASIKLSYDMLWSSDAKSCFLLCCLFLEDAEISIDDLTRHCVARSLLSHNPRTLEEARNAVLREVDALKSASLLSNDDDENVVRIHDVIRDVGISIAREEEAFLVDHSALRWPPNPTNGPSYKVMSLSFKSIEELPDGLVYPQLETLMVDNSELLDLEVPEIFFNGMMQLKVLTFTRMRMRRLPSSLAKLTNLRMLYLNKCELDDIALLKDLKWNLEVLSLTGSSIEALPLEIGQLTSLRVLDLQDCDELMVIPRGVISDLTSLEELYFPKNFNKWEATTDEKQDTNNRENVSLEELKGLLSTGQLTTLHIYIPDVMRLPKEDLIFANLKGFKISVGSEFENSEEISGRCMLKLEGNQLRNDFIPLLDKVEVLVLKLESAVHPLRLFNKLTVLIIGHFKLKYLFSPTTVRGLVHLKVLEVTSCDIMEGIVGFEGQKDENEITGEVKFSKLKQLKLTNLPNLISFFAQKEEMGTIMGSFSTRAQPLFNEQVILPVLEVFEVDRLGNIVEIWDKQSPWFNENTVSCSKLREMKVQRCKKLMNLVPSNILPRLQNLQKLCVEGCPNIESIVFKNGKEEEAADHSSLIIPQLRYLRVSDMENLKTFYSSSTASNAHSLFNHQVILPVLEVFEVDRLGNIVEIWDKQSPWLNQSTVSSFKLRDMKVQQCKTLMNLVPSNILPRLQHLQNLCVEGCPNIESIFFENEKEEEAADDSALIIPQLRYLRISDMEKLKSFYSSSRASNAQSLFNHQVIFPVLERLIIDGLGNIIKIWEKQSIAGLEEQESFLQLTDLEVRSCSKLMHVFPSNMYPLLRNLKKLKVKYCETVKGIAKFEGEIDEDGLRNEVVSPTREHLEMVEVTKIQDKQPLLEPRKEVESLRKLVHIHIDKCDQLLYVFPSHMLPQNLQQLRIENCDKLEVIFSKDPKEEKEAINDDIIVFPRLKDVTLWSLHKLKSFYTETQGFFSHKVAFPVLETLHLWDLDKITRIWDNLPLLEREKEAQSFCQLTEISVVRCNQLEYVLPSYMLPQLKTVQQLIISRCRKIEVIISNNPKEKEATNNNDTIRFPQLKEVYLEDLPNLKSFICSETQLLFSNKVAFPILKSLSLHKLDKITRIWDNQPLSEPEKEAKSFCKLLMINVVGCDQLEYVLPFYMLPQLKNLYYLRIRDCWKMKVIISNNPKEKEATNNDDTIRFPQLKYVDLRDLPNLKSFISSETQLFFSNKDAFPVLEQITLYPLGTSEFLRNETSTKKVSIEECGTSGKKK